MQKLKKLSRGKLSVILAVALVIIMLCSITPTFSWLSASSEKVVNTFAGGTIAITLDEAQVDGQGKKIDGGTRVTENNYKYTAGSVLDKDPSPTVLKGSDPSYVFIFVTNELNDKFTISGYTDAWKAVATNSNGTLYVYSKIVDASGKDATDIRLEPVFTTITVSEDLTQDEVKALGEKQITAESYAVQSTGLDSKSAIDNAVAKFASGATVTYPTITETITTTQYTPDKTTQTP